MSAKRKPNNRTSNYYICYGKVQTDTIDHPCYLGKVRSNFMGSKYVLFGRGKNPSVKDISSSGCTFRGL